MCCFTTDYHKSVLHLPQFTGIYLYLPQKCGILLQFATKVCWIYRLLDTSLLRCNLRWHLKHLKWGVSEVLKLARHKIHTFVAYLKKKLKNLTTPIFLVGLIYRWGKGPKTKKWWKQYGIHKLGWNIFHLKLISSKSEKVEFPTSISLQQPHKPNFA